MPVRSKASNSSLGLKRSISFGARVVGGRNVFFAQSFSSLDEGARRNPYFDCGINNGFWVERAGRWYRPHAAHLTPRIGNLVVRAPLRGRRRPDPMGGGWSHLRPVGGRVGEGREPAPRTTGARPRKGP
jgi:hypothetical protein